MYPFCASACSVLNREKYYHYLLLIVSLRHVGLELEDVSSPVLWRTLQCGRPSPRGKYSRVRLACPSAPNLYATRTPCPRPNWSQLILRGPLVRYTVSFGAVPYCFLRKGCAGITAPLYHLCTGSSSSITSGNSLEGRGRRISSTSPFGRPFTCCAVSRKSPLFVARSGRWPRSQHAAARCDCWDRRVIH